MELLFDNNHTSIKELYNIISLYKVKYSLKNKLPDDTYKSLKSAIKLEKEIEISIKIIVEELEKENIKHSNSKQLEFVLESVKNSNENKTMYYNLKHVQVW